MAKLLREHYKTHEGAGKRAAFENGLARGEYERGNKAHLYRYKVVPDPVDSGWRVERQSVPVLAQIAD